MIKCGFDKCNEIFNYIGNDYGRCAYLYIDLKKYGFNNENINVWYQKDKEKILVIVMQYYNGMHVYSKDADFDAQDVANLVREYKPSLVCGMDKTISKLKNYISDDEYKVEKGSVVQLINHSGICKDNAYRAKRSEIKEIAELLSKDENMGGPYGFDLLYKQLLERYDEKFGRNWISRDDSGIVSHVATYAELNDICVVSGGIVRDTCRGKGEYSKILGSMCEELQNEKFDKIISYYYGNGGAKIAHDKVGFEKLGCWTKLIRN